MSERKKDEPPELALDDTEVKELLRAALKPPVRASRIDVRQKVQQQIHERTQGRYFRDAWSRSATPKSTFLVTSLLMLLLLVLLLVLLLPVDIRPLR